MKKKTEILTKKPKGQQHIPLTPPYDKIQFKHEIAILGKTISVRQTHILHQQKAPQSQTNMGKNKKNPLQ